jgi:hypothetical protein
MVGAYTGFPHPVYVILAGLYFFRRPRITSAAPVSRANALPAEPAGISGTPITESANASPASPAIKNMIPAIFVITITSIHISHTAQKAQTENDPCGRLCEAPISK